MFFCVMSYSYDLYKFMTFNRYTIETLESTSLMWFIRYTEFVADPFRCGGSNNILKNTQQYHDTIAINTTGATCPDLVLFHF